MKPIQEIVKIKKRFGKSINLQLDLGDYGKVLEYIPTRSSLIILRKLLSSVLRQKGEAANILIGPYGKGKSHLLLVLLTLLKDRKQECFWELFQKIEVLDRETARLIQEIWEKKGPFLPVLVSATHGDLKTSMIQALQEALEKEGLDSLSPDSYYGEAVKNIQLWETEYPHTYEKWKKVLEVHQQDQSEFLAKLKVGNSQALQFFIDQYPYLTAGSVFQPLLKQDPLQIYRQVKQQLCENYGYSGIYMIFDEFSKYLEGHSEENFASDMKILQDICELANYSQDGSFFLTLVAHKSIHEYQKKISVGIKNAFKGVEGRLTEIRFSVSAGNHYQLIAGTIEKKEGFQEEYQTFREEEMWKNIVEKSFEQPCFRGLFQKQDYEKNVVEGCFPLLPICTYLLLHLSEKVAQNERTIFTFLTNREPGSFVSLLEDGVDTPIGADTIYDYFQPVFRDYTDMPQIHNEWLKADYGLSLTEDPMQRKIIKALAIVRMVGRQEDFLGQDTYLPLTLGISQDVYKVAMQKLLKAGILLYRSSIGMYAFKNNIGVDIEEEIQKEISGLSGGFSICEKLKQISELEYVIPRMYNQEYAMTRYFRYEYMTTEMFLQTKRGEYLFESQDADGKIIALISEEAIDKFQVRQHTQTLQEERLIVIVPKSVFSQTNNIKRLAAVERLMEKEEFLQANRVLLQELKLYQEDLIFEINEELEQHFSPEYGRAEIFYLGEEKSESWNEKFNYFLSEILKNYYEYTPRVNHELLNIQKVAGQYYRARTKVIKRILEKEDCQDYFQGTSPESMVYRASFLRTGIFSETFPIDFGCEKILEQIHIFFISCSGKKQSFSHLYHILEGKQYGVRRGILPLFLAMALAHQETAVVYLGEREISLDAEVLNRINEFPEKYKLYIETSSMEKQKYLEVLEELFCGREKPLVSGHFRLLKIADSMQKWYRSLPQYAMVTMELPKELQDAARNLRNHLKKAEMNPRELLLEILPQELKEDTFLETAKKIREIHEFLENSLYLLKENMVHQVRELFAAKDRERLRSCLRFWYEQQEEKVKNSILTGQSHSFWEYLRNCNTNDEGELIQELSSKLLDMYLEDWHDSTRQQFLEKLSQVKEEIESLSLGSMETEGMCQIILKNSKGETMEKFYEKVQQDSTSEYLSNVIEEALEDFGASLETNEKVAVLIEALTKLMDTGDYHG